MTTETGLPWRLMAGRKPTRRVPRFGARLLQLRGKRTGGRVAHDLVRLGVMADRSYVKKWESGVVPPPDVVWAYEQVFRLTQGDLLAELARELVVQSGRAAPAPAGETFVSATGPSPESSDIDETAELGQAPSAQPALLSQSEGSEGSAMTKEEQAILDALRSFSVFPARQRRKYLLDVHRFALTLGATHGEGRPGKHRRGRRAG